MTSERQLAGGRGRVAQLGRRPGVPPGAEVGSPGDREELAAAIVAAAEAGRKVSVAGSGHSFTEAAMTDGTMIDIGALGGVIDADPSTGLVKVGAGTILADLNRGAATVSAWRWRTSATSIARPSPARSRPGPTAPARGCATSRAQVDGLELVLADGSVRELDAVRARPAAGGAGRVGALGAITAVTLRCVPAFTLEMGRTPRPREEVLDELPERAEANDHFELFTFPYADSALVLERDRTESQPRPRGTVGAYLNDIVLENWALGALSATGKALPAAIPSLSRLAAWLASGGRVDRSQRPRSSPATAASASPRWSTGCRARAAPRPPDG